MSICPLKNPFGFCEVNNCLCKEGCSFFNANNVNDFNRLIAYYESTDDFNRLYMVKAFVGYFLYTKFMKGE